MSRVVAQGLSAEQCLVSGVMTRNPSCVSPNDAALDALATMVEGRFRHLPVIKSSSQGSQVVGLLDITKCLKDAITKLESSVSGDRALMNTIQTIERELDKAGHNTDGDDVSASLLTSLRSRIKSRTVGSLLEQIEAPEVTLKASVLEAAQAMKSHHSSAVLVVNETPERKLMGIFTTKDILLRVVAQGLSLETKVIKVMTMFPDNILPSTTVLNALQMMHQKRYLHLPVISEFGQVVGLVDVLQLTLDVIGGVDIAGGSQSDGGSEFNWRNVMTLAMRDDETSSVGSQSELLESASNCSAGRDAFVQPLVGQSSFTFKVRTPLNKVHRITSGEHSLDDLLSSISSKMNISLRALSRMLLQYVDDEGDTITVEDDKDLTAAVQLAKNQKWSCLNLTLSDASNPEPSPPPQPSVGSAQHRSNSQVNLLHQQQQQQQQQVNPAPPVNHAPAKAAKITEENLDDEAFEFDSGEE
eukprot:c20517_g1_i1.p1 GENE.c20517_g1_i1~~c20517_g1_i1.p1  ORF type:complete len:471 (-),score=142.87 c20517_g1_i1:91-1503(-)